MSTATEYLESPYSLWQEWASEQRASCRGCNFPDLMSEYVDPVHERHMMLPSKRAKCPHWGNDQDWSLSLMQYMEDTRRSCRRFGASSSAARNNNKTAQSSGTPRAKESSEFSKIISHKMKSARSRPPFRESVSIARKDGTGNNASFARAPTAVPDVSGMHIPPELHASYSFIHEQHVIWNEIMSKANMKSIFVDVAESSDSNDKKFSAFVADDEFHHFDDDDGSFEDYQKDTPDSLEGQQVALHGSFVKILGRNRVYDALANGTTKIITCIGCESNLLATLSTKLLFCPDCGTLTPIDLTKSQPQTDLLEQDGCYGDEV